MDRRQRKTREAIFKAFTKLLSQKNLNKITVGEIIEYADIGRATFYAHFETKEFLIKALCEELFCHIFDSAQKPETDHKHIFHCEAPDSVFLHLLQHLHRNDNEILQLLTCENNDIFLQYFKAELTKLLKNSNLNLFPKKDLPESFYLNHICTTFIEAVIWWAKNKINLPPETVYEYFLAVLN